MLYKIFNMCFMCARIPSSYVSTNWLWLETLGACHSVLSLARLVLVQLWFNVLYRIVKVLLGKDKWLLCIFPLRVGPILAKMKIQKHFHWSILNHIVSDLTLFKTNTCMYIWIYVFPYQDTNAMNLNVESFTMVWLLFVEIYLKYFGVNVSLILSVLFSERCVISKFFILFKKTII